MAGWRIRERWFGKTCGQRTGIEGMCAPRNYVRAQTTLDFSGTISLRKDMTAFRATGALEKFQVDIHFREPIMVLQLSIHAGSAW